MITIKKISLLTIIVLSFIVISFTHSNSNLYSVKVGDSSFYKLSNPYSNFTASNPIYFLVPLQDTTCFKFGASNGQLFNVTVSNTTPELQLIENFYVRGYQDSFTTAALNSSMHSPLQGEFQVVIESFENISEVENFAKIHNTTSTKYSFDSKIIISTFESSDVSIHQYITSAWNWNSGWLEYYDFKEVSSINDSTTYYRFDRINEADYLNGLNGVHTDFSIILPFSLIIVVTTVRRLKSRNFSKKKY